MVGAYELEVAPMMGHTTKEWRYLWRLLSKRSRVYTEMVAAGEVVREKDPEKRWGRGDSSVVAQLGGRDPRELGEAARIMRELGYSEINLNCGCPSSRVAGTGQFGAALMREPELVAECLNAIGGEVSAKHRLGVVDGDCSSEQVHFPSADQSLDEASEFLETVLQLCAHIKTFVVHARVAVLDNGSPEDRTSARDRYRADKTRRAKTLANRHVPPLRPEIPGQLKQRFPSCKIVANGGIDSIECALKTLEGVDAVMVGRALVSHPVAFSSVDSVFNPTTTTHHQTRADILDAYIDFALNSHEENPIRLVAPAYRLFAGEPGAGAYMRRLKQLAKTKLRTGLCTPATALRAASLALPPDTLNKPLTDFTPVSCLPAYDREVARAGPLARVVA